MLQIDDRLTPVDLLPAIDRMWEASARCLTALERRWRPDDGAPVFTAQGRYTARGWTEWTQGFQFGSSLLQFDAIGDAAFLEIGRRQTRDRMAPHVTHVGVHDHGFNNVSTYGNLLRLMLEERIRPDIHERALYELALKCSGAVQAARWTPLAKGGFIHSFNGPHSLFCDTIRSLRSLAMGHLLGHRLMGENDVPISLLRRLVQHAEATARFNVYYGDGRDVYDVRGRVAHEAIFNVHDGQFRCASTQQGYSPFSTWTRGLSWIMLGYPEELEYLASVPADQLAPEGGREAIETMMLRAASAACDFYIAHCPTDGVPYWDTGAPGLSRLGDYLNRPADPFNEHEPVDSSAAAIASQGLLRLGRVLDERGESEAGRRYQQAGLTVLRTLLAEPYLNCSAAHEGLLLHAVYHRPRGWDHVPEGRLVPCGESCQWGDYHLREAALYVGRVARHEPYYAFFGPLASGD